MNNTGKFDFIYSTRFWSMVITSASIILIDPALATQPWYVSLGKFLGLLGTGFVTIKTLDRSVELATVGKTPVQDTKKKK